MKNFIKGRWFPLLVAILIVAAVAFVMALFGWRITYAPNLENSWDAISAVAAWAGVIGAVLAIFSAIWVANRQNKIALIEKRLNVISKIENYISQMDSWEFTSNWLLKLMLTEAEIRVLFNQEFLDFYLELARASESIDVLRGDYKYAQEHGECHGRDEEKIEMEIQDKVACIRESFKVIKEKVYSKYLYI